MKHQWKFKSHFRRHAFGWRGSRLAIERLREALSEIRSVARTDPSTAAEGAVVLLERVAPALDQVDSSSGALGHAVNGTVAALIPVIAKAPVEPSARDALLERLWTAQVEDAVPYIESLGDYWGDLCGSPDVASAWADRLLPATRLALNPAKRSRPFFHGTGACLSALFASARFTELMDLLSGTEIWPYKQWAVRALVAQGRRAEAIRYAEACRGPWTNDVAVDAICEEVLLSAGLVNEAYQRYGLRANAAGSYAAWFRAVRKKYPSVPPETALDDLVALTPGKEGKWFAAAKDAALLDRALALARLGSADPKTLARAARDFAESAPQFALEVGLLALRGFLEGHGYEVTGADVLRAHSATITASRRLGRLAGTQRQIAALLREGGPGATFLQQVLGVTSTEPATPA